MFSFNRISAVKSLVYLSVLLSVLSFFTSRAGYGEIYPFFFWKLFSQPIGSKGQDELLRIYALDSNDTWERIPIRETKTFLRDDIMYSLSFNVNDSLNGEMRLKYLCEHLYPGYKEYRIYKEVYNPKDILEDPDNYDTVFVTKVP